MYRSSHFYVGILLTGFSWAVTSSGCKSNFEKDRSPPILQDTTILSEKAYSQLLLDSSFVADYVFRHKELDSFAHPIMDFYSRRNFHAAWYAKDTLGAAAHIFLTRLNSYVEATGDSSVAVINDAFLFDSNTNLQSSFTTNKALADIALTTSFFKYATKEYYGTDKPIRDLEWYIPRRKKDYLRLLNALVSSDTAHTLYEPNNHYYNSLKGALLQLRAVERMGGYPSVRFIDKKLITTDTSEAIRQLKNYLAITDNYNPTDTTNNFSDSLKNCLRLYQKRMGLQASDFPDTATIASMNVPVASRIKQVMINLERLRWLPEETPDNYLMVNIPDFKLHIFEERQLKWSMDVVVGKAATATNIFSDKLRYVVFNPYWNVPESIIVNELLPILKRNPGYIKQKNMEVLSGNKVVNPYSIKWSRYKTKVPYTIREKPGNKNSLGLVKFLFPNQFNTFLHDTPAKSLFENNNRAFSHGCIRLAEAKKLANYIFRNDSTFSPEKIDTIIHQAKEAWVNVKPEVPVYIVYFTTWVDHTGRLNFRNDIYGLDEQIWSEVFGK